MGQPTAVRVVHAGYGPVVAVGDEVGEVVSVGGVVGGVVSVGGVVGGVVSVGGVVGGAFSGCTKIWTEEPFCSIVPAAGFCCQTVPGGNIWSAGAGVLVTVTENPSCVNCAFATVDVWFTTLGTGMPPPEM